MFSQHFETLGTTKYNLEQICVFAILLNQRTHSPVVAAIAVIDCEATPGSLMQNRPQYNLHFVHHIIIICDLLS